MEQHGVTQQGHRTRGHELVYVDESGLPEGINWAFLKFDERVALVIKRSCWSPSLLVEAWTEYASAC